jgi:hypothetical protein
MGWVGLREEILDPEPDPMSSIYRIHLTYGNFFGILQTLQSLHVLLAVRLCNAISQLVHV